MNRIGELSDKKILFLQGPMGGFFKRLDTQFRNMGAITYRIGFVVGDYLFANKDNYTPYRGKREDWSEYLHAFLKQHQIDQIYLFGDCRFYQRHAIQISQELGLEVFVFEEGYVRPDYITLERYGVNDYSQISRKREFYDRLDLDDMDLTPPEPVELRQSERIFTATFYFLISNILFFCYPHYKHHRNFSAIKEAFFGVRNVLRRWYYSWSERKYFKLITETLSNRFYLVPLQTYNDFQILEHSEYGSIEKFIIEVLESFAHNAPEDTYLVLKHHPVDRGKKTYHKFIMDQAHSLKIDKRVLVIHDVHLPTCLKHAIGTVTINSTVGISSLYHQTPTITLGNAIYDIEGLTCKGCSLDRFWNERNEPDMELFEKYRRYLIKTTQLNGSFYGKMPTFEL